MTTQSKRLGERIRQARREASLTQEQLAYQAGVAVATVSRLENGRTSYPRLDELGRIAAVLGTTADDLTDVLPTDSMPDVAVVNEDAESEADIDAELDELTSDADLVIAFMSRVRDPKQLSRAAKLVIRDDLRRLRARQQRKS